MQILVIEDEPKMAKLLSECLTEEGYHVVVSHDGREGLELARSQGLDVVVLDLMLPGIGGVAIAQTLRKEGNRIPILMLTARDADEDIVRGLNAGADDYLTKPFSLDVFLARIRAVSRRGPVATPVTHRIEDLSIDTVTRQVTRKKRIVALTAREYDLLELLARNSPRVLTRDALIQSVWGFDGDVSENNLEAFVHLLRAKLEYPGESKLVHTVRGVGYVLRGERS
jgi:DNA-binding response OmpR family regulator